MEDESQIRDDISISAGARGYGHVQALDATAIAVVLLAAEPSWPANCVLICAEGGDHADGGGARLQLLHQLLGAAGVSVTHRARACRRPGRPGRCCRAGRSRLSKAAVLASW
jgi:hypothetical protein